MSDCDPAHWPATSAEVAVDNREKVPVVGHVGLKVDLDIIAARADLARVLWLNAELQSENVPIGEPKRDASGRTAERQAIASLLRDKLLYAEGVDPDMHPAES